MPRLKFDPLDNYPFTTELQLYTSHINHGNHLDNAQLVGLASEARLRFLRTRHRIRGNCSGAAPLRPNEFPDNARAPRTPAGEAGSGADTSCQGRGFPTGGDRQCDAR